MAVHTISDSSLYPVQWNEIMIWFTSDYDNGAYMNTGIQRSSATPMYADTTTTPVGS